MSIFYAPNIKQSPFLDEEESRHAVKVLRLSVNDSIAVVDGKGHFFETVIVKPHDKKCEIKIVSEVKMVRPSFQIHLAIAPTKNLDRIEWMVEKCVEVGIDEISFLQTRFSERKEIKIARLEKIAVAAMKQSKQAFLPKINEIQKLDLFLSGIAKQTDIQKFIAHLEEGERKTLQRIASHNANYCVLVGPEGDFSPEEIEKAKKANFQAVTLGNNRLRTETAGLYVCMALNMLHT